jgi:branched-chain amino acid transport system ATP-binding protein
MSKPDPGSVLTVSGLSVSYGVGFALREVSVAANGAEIVAILGANGAGKSTLMRSVMGLVDPVSGDMALDGKSILRSPTIERVRRGLALVPEGRRIFVQLTVEVNLTLAAAPWRRFRGNLSRELGEVYELFPVLGERRNRLASALSGGEQQMLAVGRALMARPKVMLLDEPTLGLAPVIVESLMDTLRQLAAGGMAIVIAEQNAHQVLRVADRGYVLANGRLATQGSAAELLQSTTLAAAYLPGFDDAALASDGGDAPHGHPAAVDPGRTGAQ